MLGLWLNQDRARTRRAYDLLSAIRDSTAPVIPLEYLIADCEDADEAAAVHNLLSSRAGLDWDAIA